MATTDLVAAWCRSSSGLLGIVTGFVLGNVHLPLNPPNATSPAPLLARRQHDRGRDRRFLWPNRNIAALAALRLGLHRVASRQGPTGRLAALALALPAAVLVFSFTLSYNPWAGRYFIGPVALAMPLAGFVYRSRCSRAPPRSSASLLSSSSNIFNADKPIGLDGLPPGLVALVRRRTDPGTPEVAAAAPAGLPRKCLQTPTSALCWTRTTTGAIRFTVPISHER